MSLCQQSLYGFSSSHIWMWELDHKEGWVTKNWYFQTVVLEKTFESPMDCKEIKPGILKEINPAYSLEELILKWKLQYLAMWCKKPTHWKRPWCWERLKAKGEEGGRGWDGWIALPTQWTWVRTSSMRWWRTRKPGKLQFMESRVGHNLATKQQQRQMKGLSLKTGFQE